MDYNFTLGDCLCDTKRCFNDNIRFKIIQVKSIISFTIGTLISIIFIGGLIGIATFFWFLHLGYEPIMFLEHYLKTYGFLIILVVILLIPFYIFRRKKPFFSYGLLISLIPIIFIFVLNTIDLYDYSHPREFDQVIWEQNEIKPLDMSRYLIKHNMMLDRSREDIIEMLGADYIKEHSNDSSLCYRLDIARFAYLQLDFDNNDRVKKANFTYYD